MTLFAIEDSVVGGGIVVGVLAIARGLYALWEMFSRRTTEREREELGIEAQRQKQEREDETERLKIAKVQAEIEAATQQSRITIGQMARTELSAAYEQERVARKAAHDADIRAIRHEIDLYRTRLTDLESREKDCQGTVTSLTAECRALKDQNAAQSLEMADLRAKVADLERKLKANGALPGTGNHTPLSE